MKQKIIFLSRVIVDDVGYSNSQLLYFGTIISIYDLCICMIEI